MNIFVVDGDVQKCAIALDDKRLNKMIIETAQLLSNAIHLNGGVPSYKPTHLKHPCSLWVSCSSLNYSWLLDLFLAMNEEYTYRREKIHGCLKLAAELTLNSCGLAFPSRERTEWANCSLFKNSNNTFEAYKATLCYKWKRLDKKPTWTKRTPPDWYNDYDSLILSGWEP
jgi:hypothetical protein